MSLYLPPDILIFARENLLDGFEIFFPFIIDSTEIFLLNTLEILKMTSLHFSALHMRSCVIVR